MKVNEYKVLMEAVEQGVHYGWNRAHKHDDNPSPATIKNQIEQEVLTQICEYFEFSGAEEDIW